MSGEFLLNGERSYLVSGELTGKHGSLEGLDLANVFLPVLQKLPQVSTVDAQALKGAREFKTLKVKGKFTESTSEVDEFVLKSSSGDINLSARGSVYNSSEKESAVKATISGDYIQVKGEANKRPEKLHFLLTGKGVRIRPKLQYTLDMMKKNAKVVR